MCDLARLPLENSAFRNVGLSLERVLRWDHNLCADQVRQVLRQMGLTMSKVSSLTRMRYGDKTAYRIPKTFLYRYREGITPHICQIIAFSEITGYRFADWMRLYGFDLDLILASQLRIFTERTAMVRPNHICSLFDSGTELRKVGFESENERYLFAKIGSRDAVVYPKVLPGSVVRADRRQALNILDNASFDDRLWLVEHLGGIACCYVKRVSAKSVVLLPNRPPLSGWPLRLSEEVRILGLVDLELRPREPAEFWPLGYATRSELLPKLGCNDSRRTSVSTLLRRSRARCGLTLRAAHQMTMRIARLLGNREYGIALGQLSDYEATNMVPRHVAKILSLCTIYGIDPFELMRTGGIHIDDSDKAPLLFDDARNERSDLRQSA